MQIKQDQMYPHPPIDPGVTYPYYIRIQIYPGSYVNMRHTHLPTEPSATEPYYTRMQMYKNADIPTSDVPPVIDPSVP